MNKYNLSINLIKQFFQQLDVEKSIQEKKEILELKLKLISILIDKKLCIRNQQYEKVADLRDEEKELLQLLENKAIEIKEHQQIFEEKIPPPPLFSLYRYVISGLPAL